MSDPDAEPRGLEPSSPSRRRGRKRRTWLGRVRRNVQERTAVVLTVLIALTVVGSLLAVGTVHVRSLLVVAPLAILAGALGIWLEDEPRRRFPAPAWVLALLALYSLLQAVPLPFSWVKVLSPTAAQTWTDALRLVHLNQSRWVSLSVEPGASRVEALKWLSYAAIFVAAAKLARERGAQRGIVILVGSALLGGVLCVIHGLFGLEEWLFLYQPETRPPWAPAPLLNPNNFAGYLNLALFAGIGLLFARKQRLPRWLIALVLVLLAALVILTASRGGVLALAVGFALSGLAFRWQQLRVHQHGSATVPGWIPLSGLGIAAVALAIIGATDLVWQQLLDETTGKLRILEYSQRIIADHLWFGTGRGSFGTTFAAYRQALGDSIAHYAENFVVQWIVEWGLPVSLLGLGGLLWTLWPSRHGFGKQALQTASLIAVATLLLHNLVDLATEVAAVALATSVLMGTVHGTTWNESERRHPRRPKHPATPRARVPSLVAAGCLLSGLGLVLLVARTGQPDSIDQRKLIAESLSQLVGKSKGDPAFAVVRRRLESALLRCPADPYLPLIGAILTRESGQSPYTWLNQALRRDPLSARPHFLLAETLAARGARNQALLELKSTVSLSPKFVVPVADKVLAWAPELEQLLRAVPDGADGIQLLNVLVERSSTQPQRRDELLQLSLSRAPREVSTNALAAQILFTALESKAEPCGEAGRLECESRLRRHATTVIENTERPQASVMMKARLLAYEGKFDEAERWLGDHCYSLPDPTSCNYLRTSYAAKLEEPHRFTSAAMAYTSCACSNSAACAKAFTWLGNLEIARKSLNAALSRFERAAEEQPTVEAWLRVAEIAARLGRLSQSRSALNTARRLGGGPKVTELEKRLLTLQHERMLEALSK